MADNFIQNNIHLNRDEYCSCMLGYGAQCRALLPLWDFSYQMQHPLDGVHYTLDLDQNDWDDDDDDQHTVLAQCVCETMKTN